MKPLGLVRESSLHRDPGPMIGQLLADGSTDLDRWRTLPRAQRPPWPDQSAVDDVVRVLGTAPPIVTHREVDQLRHRLGLVADGRAFLLQAGDRTEMFASNTESHLVADARTLLRMALVLAYGGSMPVVKVARVAGGYTKPVSSPVDGFGLPSYRGDMINAPDPTPGARTADPQRLIMAYANAASAMNILRAHAAAGLGDVYALHDRNRCLLDDATTAKRYEQTAIELNRALFFMRANEVTGDRPGNVALYSSHELLALEYERSMTRLMRGRAYGLSGHSLWIGEHTRQLDGAHIDYASRIANPIGVQLGPATTPQFAVELCEKLNPHNVPGRLTLITQMGSNVRDVLPQVVEKVTAAGCRVLWQCEPMQGSTAGPAGRRAPHFDQVVAEVRGFFEVHRWLGTHPGGLHVTLAHDAGGTAGVDPRAGSESAHDLSLSSQQLLELAFLVAGMLRG